MCKWRMDNYNEYEKTKSKHPTNHCQYVLNIGIMTFSYSALKGQPSVHISSDKFSI